MNLVVKSMTDIMLKSNPKTERETTLTIYTGNFFLLFLIQTESKNVEMVHIT